MKLQTTSKHILNPNHYSFMQLHRRAVASFTLLMFLFQSVAFAAGPQVPAAGSTTTAYTSANGVPVVNIAAPNAAGLSHNRYDSFNVPTNGTVLNNTSDVSQSALAGFIRGNPNLNGNAANIILNEVTSTQRSLLQGYLEVHGQKAEVIVANPNGITCSGCGFINTPRATLTTGVSNIDANGNLTGFTVHQGDVLINGLGLDAGSVNYLDLLSRSISVQGQVNAKDLQLVSGANQFDYASRAVTGSVAATGATSTYAIDSSILGGMYADRIRLLANENGIGVRLLGDVAATVSDVTMNSSGSIELKNKLYAATDINVAAKSIAIGGDPKNYLYAERDIHLGTIGGGDFFQADGLLYAGRNTSISASLASFSGVDAQTFAGNDFSVVANNLFFGAGSYSADHDITLSGSSISTSGGGLIYGHNNLSLQATGVLDLGAGKLVADQDLLLSGAIVTDTSGSTGMRSAGHNLILSTASNLILDNGQIYDAGNKLALNANNIQIGGATATTLTGGYSPTGSIELNAQVDIKLTNNGSIQSSGDVAFNAPGNVSLAAGADLLAIHNFYANSYSGFDLAGTLVTGLNADFRPNTAGGMITTHILSTGALQSYGVFSLLGSNAGQPRNNVRLVIDAGDQSKSQGQIAAEEFNIQADTLQIGSQDATHFGLLQGGNRGGSISANHLQLDGVYSKIVANTNAGATSALNLYSNLTNLGFIYAFGNLELNVLGNVNNLNGAAISSGFGNLNIHMNAPNATFDNQVGATLYGANLSVLYPVGGTFYNHATGPTSADSGVVQSLLSTTIGGDCDPLGITAAPCVQGFHVVNFINEGIVESTGDINIIAENFRNNIVYAKVWSPLSSNGTLYEGDSGRYTGYDKSGGCGVHNTSFSVAPPVNTPNGNPGYYVTCSNGFEYADFTRFFVRSEQYVSPLPAYRPRISAGGTLHIATWAGNNSGGTLEGNTVIIDPIDPFASGSTFLNEAISRQKEVYSNQGRSVWQCLDASFGSVLSACLGNVQLSAQGDQFPFGSQQTLINTINLPVDVSSIISAGTFVSNIGTLINSGIPTAPTVTPTTTATGTTIGQGAPILPPALPALPTGPNGLFVLNHAANAKYLVEGNPLYASAQNPFLGSDYLAKLLGLDPDKILQRLGDGNYENRLIKDQIQQLIGLSLLRSASSEFDQQKMLMDNALLETKEQKLAYGVALTSDQVASLKHDIVWMVERVVQGKRVLTPVVYLSDATRAQRPDGATIVASTAVIKGDSFVNRGGTVSGSDKLIVVTRKDIVNSSGTLMGGTVVLKSIEGDIINKTETFRKGGANNYTTEAGKTGGIYANKDLYVDAGRDVKVEGGTMYADGTATIKAGRDVSVTSLVLESRTSTNITNRSALSYDHKESSETTQHALTASVGSKGNMTMVSGRDINLTGAVIGSENGDATLISKEGNVNVSTLELKNSKTEKSEKTGFFAEDKVDASTTSAGAFSGVQNTKKEFSGAGTQNVGTSITGKGVNVVAKKGDINIKGSTIEAGENGVYIDAAKDVNVTAAYDTYTSTSKSETHQFGTSADANADGAFTGLRYKREENNSNDSANTAVTSGIKSGGDITVRAGNKLTNEGTDYDAKNDIYVSAKEVENKAANSTSTYAGHSEGDRYGVETGVTTNGMGQSVANQATGKGGPVVISSPEAQVRVGGESSRSDTTEATSTAKTTQFKAGGNVVFDVKGKMVDEGTQYDAGKTIQIDANSYENKAAANTKTTTTESTNAGGQATVGVNAATEATGTVSGYGGHSKDATTTSDAVTGSFKAGNNVVIRTKGDTTLEGTKLQAGKNVVIDAGGDVNFKQANNTKTTTASSEQASANLSASACVDMACASGGVGADGRTAKSNESTSKGVAGGVNAGGNIVIKSGGDMTLQGTNLKSGQDTVLDAGKNLDFQALKDTHTLTGKVDGGGAQVGLGGGTSSQALKNGSVNVTGSFEKGRDNVEGVTKTGADVKTGGTFVLKSGNDARMEGTKVSAADAVVDVKGNFKMESAQSTEVQDSTSTKGKVGVGGSKGGGAMGMQGAGKSGGSNGSSGNSMGGSADVDVDVHKKDNLTNQNASIKTTGKTSLNVGGDATIAGARIDAQGGVSGDIKGNLNIESRTDRIKQEDTSVKAFAGVNSVTTGSASGAKKSAGQKIDHAQGKGLEAAGNIGGSGLDVDVKSSKKDEVTLAERSGISGGAGGLGKLAVGGNVTLKGASEEILGANIKGGITKTDIETHKNNSDVNFRVPISLAGATGQEPGKAAEVNGSVFKASGSSARKPNHSPEHEVTTRPRVDTEYANNPNATRPRADTEYANNPNATRPRADTEYANNPNATRPRADTEYANNPNINRPRANTEPVPARPRVEANNAYVGVNEAPIINRPRSASDPVTTRPAENNPSQTRPRADTEYANNPRPNVANNEPPVTRPRSASEPVLTKPQGGTNASGYTDVLTTNRPRSNSEPAPQQQVAKAKPQLVGDSYFDPSGNPIVPEVPLVTRPRSAGGHAPPLPDARHQQAEDASGAYPAVDDDGLDLPQAPNAYGRGGVNGGLPPVNTVPKQQILVSAKGFKMKTISTDFVGEKDGNGKFWKDGNGNNNVHVKYLTPQERDDREIVVRDGLFVLKKTGEKYHTGDKLDGAIFVMDGDGRIFASMENKVGQFHHSSFLGGEPTAMAGHMVVQDGKLLHINNVSGHYMPDVDQLQGARQHLTALGMDLTNVPKIGVKMINQNGRMAVDWVNIETGAELPPDSHPMSALVKKIIEDRNQHNPVQQRAPYDYNADVLPLAEPAGQFNQNGYWRGDANAPVEGANPPARRGSAYEDVLNTNNTRPRSGSEPLPAKLRAEGAPNAYVGVLSTNRTRTNSEPAPQQQVAKPKPQLADDSYFDPSGNPIVPEVPLVTRPRNGSGSAPLRPEVNHVQPQHGPDEGGLNSMPDDGDLVPTQPQGSAYGRRNVPNGGVLPQVAQPISQANQQVLVSQKGFKMKEMGSGFVGEKDGKGQFWIADRKNFHVKYLTPAELSDTEVVVQNGLLVSKKTGQKFDTGDKMDGAIFVMDGEGRIYASTQNKVGQFHHSSFLGGEPTAMAGHMVVQDGKLVHINNISGHYRPDIDQLQSMRQHLSDQGMDLTGVANVGVKSKVGSLGMDWVNLQTGRLIPRGHNPMSEAVYDVIDSRRGVRPPVNNQLLPNTYDENMPTQLRGRGVQGYIAPINQNPNQPRSNANPAVYEDVP